MTVLRDYTVVIPTQLPENLSGLSQKLVENGAVVAAHTCSNIPAELVGLHQQSLIILDLINDKECVKQFLHSLQDTDTTRQLPVFAIVKDDSGQSAEEALSLGVADYITEHDSLALAIQKIKTVLGEPDNFSGATEIDITPSVASGRNVNLRVYAIEDDPLLRNLLRTKLEATGCIAEFSVDGKGVNERILDFKPDVIILDLLLPGINGLDVLAELKRDQRLEAIPVVIFSNNDDQESRQRAADLGAAGFYVKAMTELSALIRELERLSK